MKKQEAIVTIASVELEKLKENTILREKVRSKLNCSDSTAIILAEVDKFIGLEKTLADKDKQIAEVQHQAITMEVQLAEKAKLLKEAETQVATLTVEVEKSQQTIDTLKNDYGTALEAIQALKSRCLTPVLHGWKKKLYDILFKGGIYG